MQQQISPNINLVIMRLPYIGSKQENLNSTRQEARDLFKEVSHYITDEREYEGYKKDIEELETTEELEKLISDLHEEAEKGAIREREEKWNYRNWPEDNYDSESGIYSKV